MTAQTRRNPDARASPTTAEPTPDPPPQPVKTFPHSPAPPKPTAYARLCRDAAAAGISPGRLLADRINALGQKDAAHLCGITQSGLHYLMLQAGVRHQGFYILPGQEWAIVPKEATE